MMHRGEADKVVGLILAKKRPGGGAEKGGGIGDDYRVNLEAAMEEFLAAVGDKDPSAMADAFEYAHELCSGASIDMDSEREHMSRGSKEY